MFQFPFLFYTVTLRPGNANEGVIFSRYIPVKSTVIHTVCKWSPSHYHTQSQFQNISGYRQKHQQHFRVLYCMHRHSQCIAIQLPLNVFCTVVYFS